MSNYPNNEQFERLVSLVSIGLSVALEHGKISINEAEHLMFSPATMELIEKRGANTNLKALVHDATEIDDVAELAPNGLVKLLQGVRRQALDSLPDAPSYDFQQDKWLHRLFADPET